MRKQFVDVYFISADFAQWDHDKGGLKNGNSWNVQLEITMFRWV